MRAYNILWVVDEEDVELPSEIKIPKGMTDEEEISDYISDVTGFCHEGFELDDSEVESSYFYETSDGFFTYYVNSVTGEKKFELEEGDILVERDVDDFFRSSIPIFE